MALMRIRPHPKIAEWTRWRDENRMVLPKGRRKKRNGKSYLPAEFIAEIEEYLEDRGNPGLRQWIVDGPKLPHEHEDLSSLELLA